MGGKRFATDRGLELGEDVQHLQERPVVATQTQSVPVHFRWRKQNLIAIADCVKSHAADLSNGCKDAMAKAEAGNQ